MRLWMMRIAASALVGLQVGLLFALTFVARPAFAGGGPPVPRCAAWPDMAVLLSQGYGEALLFDGAPQPGAPRIAITARPDGTTWTALTIEPSGLACIRGVGGGWRAGSAPPAGVPG